MTALGRTAASIAGQAALCLSLAFLWAAPAQAACGPTGGNVAGIVQDADHGQARIVQSASVAGAACVVQGGDHPTVVVIQIGGSDGANIAGVVQGGGTGQRAYVEQDGAGNRVTVGQAQADGATALGAGSLLPRAFLDLLTGSGPALGSAAVSAQLGSGNTASIQQQSGADHAYAEIGQRGDANTALITQGALVPGGGGNFASLYQDGSGNAGRLTQAGAANSASLQQTGANLTGTIDQTSDGNTAALVQTGTGLSYAITQNGTSTVAGGITFAGVAGVSVSQSAAGVNVSLH